jgi:hypothetical protein
LWQEAAAAERNRRREGPQNFESHFRGQKGTISRAVVINAIHFLLKL